MADFEVCGPFPIEYEKRAGGRALVFDDFWSGGARALADERGVYVFAIRNRALTPIYVGKATVTFKQETFNGANRHKYQNGFSRYGKGTPLMYFVVHPKSKGPTNNKEIREIEDFLIQTGAAQNPDLENVRGAQQPNWCIKGVIRPGAGKPTKAAVDVAKMFDIRG